MTTSNRQPLLPNRRSIRLPSHDYRCPGAYFVTMCTWQRHKLFGEVIAGEMCPSACGSIAGRLWTLIPQHFPSVRLDEYVVMPDHFHGIVVIETSTHENQRFPNSKPQRRTRATPASPQTASPHRPRGPTPASLGAIIGSYKSAVTREINLLRETPGQRL